MSYRTPEFLRLALDAIALRGSFASAAKASGISESGIYKILRDSKRDATANRDDSPLLFVWREGEQPDWMHKHVVKAKSENLLATLFLVIEQNKIGIATTDKDPSSGRPLLLLNPSYQHLTQQQFDALRDPLTDDPLDAKLRFMWNDDGTPQLQQTVQQLPASLRAKILTGTIPTFRESATIDHNVSGQVVHIVEPAAYVRRADRQIVDAEFRELPAPRQSYDQLKERERLLDAANAHLARTDRVTRPDGAVLDANGQPLSPSGHTQPSSAPRPVREDQADAPVRPRQQEMAHETAPDLVQPAPAPRPYRRDSNSSDAVAALRDKSGAGNLRNSFR